MAPSAPRKHLRLVVPADDHSDASTREFKVRFTQDRGALARLRKPSNKFGWVGSGVLCFDERGLEIAARQSSFFGLRRTRRRLHAGEIRDAHREGAAIRITLLDGAHQQVLRLWADDTDAAAQIISLLPTSRTVEVDGAEDNPPAEPLKVSWRLIAGAALLLLLAWVTAGRFANAPRQPQAPRVLPIPDRATAQGHELRRAVAAASDAEVLLAWGDLQRFTQGSDALTAQFRTAFNALLSGELAQEEFANELERWFGPQWRSLEKQLPPSASKGLRSLADDPLRAVAGNWQRALELYTHGLRTHDPAEVNRAFDRIRIAEQHGARARALLEEIERRHRGTAEAVSRDR